MQAVDFPRSFLLWRVDVRDRDPRTLSHRPPYAVNNARVQVDATCEITERSSGHSELFVLGASCKTEQVGVQRDIWLQPNADFVPIFSAHDFSYIKTYDHTGRRVMSYPPSLGPQPHRDRVPRAEAFASSEIALTRINAEALTTADAIVDAVLAKERLVCRTTIESERYVTTLEYPAKTFNANEVDGVYQPDTGPILVPDLSVTPDGLMDSLELAFVAFNALDSTEFLVRVPVRLSGDVAVMHYAKSVRLGARNEVFKVS